MKNGKYIFYDFLIYLALWAAMTFLFDDYSVKKSIIYAIGQALLFTLIFSGIGKSFTQTLTERRQKKKSQP